MVTGGALPVKSTSGDQASKKKNGWTSTAGAALRSVCWGERSLGASAARALIVSSSSATAGAFARRMQRLADESGRDDSVPFIRCPTGILAFGGGLLFGGRGAAISRPVCRFWRAVSGLHHRAWALRALGLSSHTMSMHCGIRGRVAGGATACVANPYVRKLATADFIEWKAKRRGNTLGS